MQFTTQGLTAAEKAQVRLEQTERLAKLRSIYRKTRDMSLLPLIFETKQFLTSKQLS